MIEILTLFFGLFSGVQTVELAVAETVAAVEIRLDGEAVGGLRQPPWTLRVDLGAELEPHELTAIARGADGGELGRARRWINLEAGPPADPDGDPRTAVAVTLDPGRELPPPREMGSWFTAGGEPLEVSRVEAGTPELVIVRDPAAQPFLERLEGFFRQIQPVGEALDLGDDVDVRFLSPRAAPVSKILRPKHVFNFTDPMPSREGSLLWHAAQIRTLHFRPRISDAAAVAGLEAHSGSRRRAVLLLLADEAMGPSRYPPSAVRSYLEALQVPLFVWRFARYGPISPPAADPADWGTKRSFTDPRIPDKEAIEDYAVRVEGAARELRDHLRRQRVVWLRGEHPPHRIRLSSEAAGIALSGGGR